MSVFMDSDSMPSGNNNNNQSSSPGSLSDSTSPRSSSTFNHKTYNWFYEKSELRRTPSLLDGINFERERRYRNEGARFILNVGSEMKLRYTTLATGVVYFHRFYMFHSFKVFPRYVTAACCLFLAGKAEETPKKCKDIIKIAQRLLTPIQFQTFGEDPKEEVLTMERIVLQTIRFDLMVVHPYQYLVEYAKGFKGNKEKIHSVLQMAWTFTNDSLCTTICLQWEPEIVAIAMIFLASKIRYEISDWEGRLPHQKHWWDIYVEDLTVEQLEDVCHQVLDLYSRNKNEEPRDSPPMSPTIASTAGIHSKMASMSKAPTSSIANLMQSSVTGSQLLTATMQQPLLRPQPPIPPNIPVNMVANVPSTIPAIGGLAGSMQISGNNIPLRLLPQNAMAAVSTVNGINQPPPPPPPIPPQWDPTLASFYNNGQFPLSGTTGQIGGPPVLRPIPTGLVAPNSALHPGLHPHAIQPIPIAQLGRGIPPPPQPPIPPSLSAFVSGQRKS